MRGAAFLAILLILVGVAFMVAGVRGTVRETLRTLAK